ncbi:MAG: hypothetical protein FWD88_02905 [Treponema sp.]|nr:hypothetical protein [Treponema sp.]
MEDLTNNPVEGSETRPPDGRFRIRAFPILVKTGVRYALVLSIVFFVLYMASSMPDPGVPDYLLFTLLRLMRYAAFLLSVFSAIALGFSTHYTVQSPSLRNALGILRYFLLGLLGAIMVMFSLLIVAMVEGN